MGLLAPFDALRRLLTGEPKDPAEKGAWHAERAQAKQDRLSMKARAGADRPDYEPPK
jgi:hypothetical protein